MSHEVVRPKLHDSARSKGRVVRFEDLVNITQVEPLRLLRTFGPLSSTTSVEGGIVVGGGTSWCRWTWFIFFELKEGGTFKVQGSFDDLGTAPLSLVDGLRKIDVKDLLNSFVPAGWAERLCAVWEVGIRSLKLEGAHGMTCALNHTLRQGTDDTDTIWCLRGYLADGTLYNGRNPIRA